ncbi:MAG: undecaprenyl-diphosphate phosphatase [Calditrichia bacterium]
MPETVKSTILESFRIIRVLPISSSGHLVLFGLLDHQQAGIAFEIFVHFGTLAPYSPCITRYFRNAALFARYPQISDECRRISNEEDRYCALTFYIIATIPAVIVGLFFKDTIESLPGQHNAVLGALSFTGAVMWSSRYTQEDSKFFNLATAILIGCAQAFAIIPGISRSGSTIVMALWLGVKRETAARFSFLLSIPVILGATILQVKDFMEAPPPSDQMMNIAFATIAAAISGYFAIILLLDIIRKQKLEWFGVYCVTVALIGIVYVNFF